MWIIHLSFALKCIFAKHKTLALPTIVRITNLYNGYSINVRINDRGPKNNFRIIELTKKTASYLKIKNKGFFTGSCSTGSPEPPKKTVRLQVLGITFCDL